MSLNIRYLLILISMVPLASILAESTEVLAYQTGPKIGLLLNATFGNAVDLILLFALLRSSQMEIAKASIVGSILTTLILVVGLSQLMGGLKNGIQHFDKEQFKPGFCGDNSQPVSARSA